MNSSNKGEEESCGCASEEWWQLPWPFGPLVPEAMPEVKRSRTPPPDGWELMQPPLEELDQKMREAETVLHEGKRKVESLWPICRIHHQKTHYIFDLFYKRKAISRELYECCIKEGYADKPDCQDYDTEI
ncbi:hypothetical protein IHE44_0003362 [Lamprotornis superbus]|uniref:Uncharacterized protein n=1 Tax=Lamprotornis superbus TaxID=245042 RepID=A0A835NEB2_9PASS|nr:hypothetical protein IHE44_0003362 [Lamprotornis superbus]